MELKLSYSSVGDQPFTISYHWKSYPEIDGTFPHEYALYYDTHAIMKDIFYIDYMKFADVPASPS
jgi:hypothetical protein